MCSWEGSGREARDELEEREPGGLCVCAQHTG